MRISLSLSIVITLACSLVAAASCRKDEAGTTNPDAATDEDLLGLDVGSGADNRVRGKPVPVGCIQDPSDPDCADVLGVTATDAGELEFAGDTCRINLCHAHGDCELDADGFVVCSCDADAGGPNCKKRKR